MDRPTPQGPVRIRSQTAPVLLRDTFGLAVALSAARARSAPGRRVVVEERYLQIFKLDPIRPAVVADGLAEIVFFETRRSRRVTLL